MPKDPRPEVMFPGDRSWMDERKQLCYPRHPAFFTPTGERQAGERQEEKERREGKAKDICNQCPVKDKCLTFALHAKESYGIWGGKTEDERRQILARAAVVVAEQNK